MTTRLADRIAKRFRPDLDRRTFLSRSAVTATAVVAAPHFIVKPTTAYAAVCAPSQCPPGSRCSPTGYTEMCCTLSGQNSCPPNTIAAGWWRADGSGFCGPNAPRYYLDCNATQGTPTTCTCANCNCGNWKVACTNFRYGNCNNHIPVVGAIVCRIVTCTAPWVLEPTCTTSPRVDNNTRFHDRPCLHPEPSITDAFARAVTSRGAIYTSGGASYRGGANTIALHQPIVGIAGTPSGNGYWLVASDGGIFSYGDARFHGSAGGIRLNQPVVGMASTPTANGYWLVARDGGVFAYGDAQFFGSMGGVRLNQAVNGMAATRTGRGYWLVARDGGIFSFGDARFHGSGVGRGISAPFVGMAVTQSGNGYWLVAADGRVVPCGDAPSLQSGPPALTASITAMARSRTGNGYVLVGGDGSKFPYGDAGSRVGTALPVSHSVVGIATNT